MDYSEDNIQAIALDYVREIEELRPDGPLVIGGNCQGAIIGLAIAQHLLRRRRHVPLLILMEWSFPAQPYAGPVGLLFGRESEVANPYLFFRQPERLWQRSWPRHQVELIPGAHGQFFRAPNVQPLAAAVRRLIDAALEQPLPFLPAKTLCAELAVDDPPERMRPGEQRPLQVRVTNRSALDWPEGETFGLTLVNHWLDAEAKPQVLLDGATPLPALRAGATAELALRVRAPPQPAAYQLALRVIEEGVHWQRQADQSLRLPVEVDGLAAPPETPPEATPEAVTRLVLDARQQILQAEIEPAMDAIGRFRHRRPHLLAPLIPLHWLLQHRGYPREAAALLADLHAAFPNDPRLPTLAPAAERLQNPTLTEPAAPG